MADNNILSGRVPADTMEKFEEFRAERDLTKSEALRKVIDAGMEKQSIEETAARIDWAGYFRKAMFYFGLVFAGMMLALIHAYISLPQWISAVGGFLILAGLGGYPYILYQISKELGDETDLPVSEPDQEAAT